MKFNNIELFIFDMDGLIFETEKIFLKIMPEVIKSLGYPVNKDIIYNSIGMTTKNIENLYKNYYGENFPYSTFSKKIHQKLLEHNKLYGLELCDGVIDVLKYLKENNKKCVIASSSDKFIINEYINRNNLSSFFIDYTAGSEVTHGKPNPEIFLLAAKKQNVDPKNCIVFEDSYNGIRAAYKANMKAIMVPNVLDPNEEMENICTLIIKNIKEILKYL